MTLIFDEHDPRLTRHEVQTLRSLQLRLQGRHFRSPCSEDGDLELRGEG